MALPTEKRPFVSKLSQSHDRAEEISGRLQFLRNLVTSPELVGLVPQTYHRDEHFWLTAYSEYARVNNELHGAIPDKPLRRSVAAAIALQGAVGLVERDEKAAKDTKTGAWTHETLQTYVENLFASGENNVGVLFFDLDNFKKYNDRYGHGAGNDLLKGLVKLLQETYRLGDLVARVGGEEIVVLLRRSRLNRPLMAKDITRLAEMGRKAIQRTLGQTASVGATLATDGDTFQSLYDRADKLMYQAKANGKNCVASDAVEDL